MRPGIFYILDGYIKAYTITRYGEENIIVIRQHGDIIGLSWAMTGNSRGVIHAAITDAQVQYMPTDDFLKTATNSPALSKALLDKFVEMYSQHTDRILTLEFRSVRERLVCFLLCTARRIGADTPRGRMIRIPLKHQDIAGSINASRETANRELAALEELGLIEHDQYTYTLRNIKELEHFIS